MASSFFALFDDIATILDDVAAMTKVAAKKTSGVLGDDLALNAQQVVGVSANRELPVVWAVAKGSAVNKLILVPAALIISTFLPTLISPLLMIGGAFLCFEGCEKIFHKKSEKKKHEAGHKQHIAESISDDKLIELEKEKIKGAVKTDFILSAEIIVISLGTVAASNLATKIGVLTSISAIMTIGVYGLVAGIVKIDDFGFYLISKKQKFFGQTLLKLAPILMKFLSVGGLIAMFLVGGGIVAHGVHDIADKVQFIANLTLSFLPEANFLKTIINTILEGFVGLLVGSMVLMFVELFKKLKVKKATA
jgi:predicted DNA repair protein MutK